MTQKTSVTQHGAGVDGAGVGFPGLGMNPGRITLSLLASLFLLLTTTSAVDAQEQRNLRHILVANEQVANKLLVAAKSGTDFKAMARRYSLDVGTKVLGGDLDWVSPGQMEPEFSKAAFQIPEAGGFATCKTRYGWHVIQLVEIRGNIKPDPDKDDTQEDNAEKPDSTGDAARKPVPVDPLADRNEDLSWQMAFSDRTYNPGEQVKFTIRVTNETDADLQVVDPRLWPLGMIVRYQFGQMNMPMSYPRDVATENFKMGTLAAGASMQRSFAMSDYLGSDEAWPIVRVIWRGDILFNRVENLGVDTAFIDDFDRIKSRWRYYRCEEANYNLLPQVKAEDRWFLCLFSNGRIWIELDRDFLSNLRSWTIRSVREGQWDQIGLEVNPGNGIFFGTVDQGKATGIPIEKLGNRPDSNPRLQKGDFYAFPTKVSDGTMGFGKRFGIVLNEKSLLFRDAVKVGSVVLEEGDPLARIVARQEAKQQVQLTLALAWPKDLLPERTMKAIVKFASMEDRSADADEDEATSAAQPVDKSKVVIGGQDTRRKGAENTSRPTPEGTTSVIKPPKSLEPLPTVYMETDNGSFLIRLYEDDAPNTVAHFLHLVESGFYDGKIFHRRVKTETSAGFVQGGSPDGTSAGVLDYTIKDEPNKKRVVKPFTLVMARHHTRPHSASAQFLIALDRLEYLDGTYTVFGEIVNGQKSASRLGEGSKIKKVTVRHKRDREYNFEKFVPKQ